MSAKIENAEFSKMFYVFMIGKYISIWFHVIDIGASM